MSFTYEWDETKPAGSRSASLGDDDIREFKAAIRERLAEDHQFADDESGDNNIGHHKTITLSYVEATDPSNEANIVKLYIKDIAAKAELHAVDEDGNVIIMTKSGKLAVLGSEGWRSGDLLISSSTDTPTGWTNVSTTYDNKFIRIGDDTPLTTTGGSDTHNHGAATGSTTLTAAQSGVPAHTHNIDYGTETGPGGGGNRVYGLADTSSEGNIASAANSAAAASEGHTHTVASADNIPAYIQARMYKKD